MGQVLWKGRFSEVNLGRSVASRETHVLKFIRKEAFVQFQSQKDSSLSLGSEATLLAHLDHPNIVHLVCCVQTMESICLVMEYLAGGTLLESLLKGGRFT